MRSPTLTLPDARVPALKIKIWRLTYCTESALVDGLPHAVCLPLCDFQQRRTAAQRIFAPPRGDIISFQRRKGQSEYPDRPATVQQRSGNLRE